jgi:HD superfamily phosphohydrolase
MAGTAHAFLSKMNYVVRVYGSVEIDEPVLLDLMESAAVRRLHGVLQHGISGLLGITHPTTRYEHSVGVMILVRRLGALLEEQIAALLHDVSHTVFSHVIDYVFNWHDSQSYHEEMKEQYVAGTDLPHVLAQHNYDWQEFMHEENFPLLEQPSPALCADRLDYFLRDSHDLGLASDEQLRSALDHLTVNADRIVVDDVKTARWLGYTFISADEASWANFREVGLYELTAQAIRIALDSGALTSNDLWSTDEIVWDKLHASPVPELQAQLSFISPGTLFAWDENAPTFRVSTKIRTIDPQVQLNGRLRLLSELDPDFARHRRAYLDRKSGQWPVRVISP